MVRLIQVAGAVQAAECETLFEGDSNAVSTGTTTCSFVLQAGRLAGRFTSRFAYGVQVQPRKQNAANIAQRYPDARARTQSQT